MLDRIYGDITVRKQEEGLRSRIQGSLAHHLLALINDILDLAKIEAGRMPLHLDNVPLQDIIDEINVQIDPLVQRRRGWRITGTCHSNRCRCTQTGPKSSRFCSTSSPMPSSSPTAVV